MRPHRGSEGAVLGSASIPATHSVFADTQALLNWLDESHAPSRLHSVASAHDPTRGFQEPARQETRFTAKVSQTDPCGRQGSAAGPLPPPQLFSRAPQVEPPKPELSCDEDQVRLETLRRDVLPELQEKREELQVSIRAIEAKDAEVRKQCAEAEREAREELDLLLGHLTSVETLKVSVLGREWDVRTEVVEGVNDVVGRCPERGVLNVEAMRAFLEEFPDLCARAETLRSISLPHVEVSDDIPFEVRERNRNLHRATVLDTMLSAKDVCLWTVERQARQLARDSQEITARRAQVAAALNRCSEELTFSCYFCGGRFSGINVNTRCKENQGARGAPFDSQVPSHIWCAGVHFWVPHSEDQPPS